MSMATRSVCVVHPDVEASASLGCTACHREGALSWEQVQAGVRCAGCGQPHLGERLPPLGHGKLTPAQLEAYDAEEKRFKAQHAECVAVQFRYSGSLHLHCGRCCPPTPIPPTAQRAVIDMLRALQMSDATV